jgi:hypothetical protein
VKRALLAATLFLGCSSPSGTASDAGPEPGLEASALDVPQETVEKDDVVASDAVEGADVVDAGVFHCISLYSCVEYHDGRPCDGALAGPCGTPDDPANDICVLRPGVLVYYYPQVIPYPGIDGGVVIIGAPSPECQRP